ncbi:MAG: hypothetical protein QOF18_1500 [Frankiaceae bacterium]|jgi:hypothetical protein|nr:hypothetical protein [Frankiaceae bacterium]
MKRIMRSAVLASAGIASIALGTSSPAFAATEGAFNGTAHINCFGCGTSTGTAALKVTGAIGTKKVIQGAVSSSYTVVEAKGTCPAVGSATGSFSGAINGTFTWTRVGATAVLTTAGGIKGDGIAAFAVTQPKGLPCGGPVTATVVGSVAGT